MGLRDAEAGGEVAGGVARGEPEITEAVETVGVVGELDGFGGRDGEQGFEGVETGLICDPCPATSDPRCWSCPMGG